MERLLIANFANEGTEIVVSPAKSKKKTDWVKVGTLGLGAAGLAAGAYLGGRKAIQNYIDSKTKFPGFYTTVAKTAIDTGVGAAAGAGTGYIAGGAIGGTAGLITGGAAGGFGGIPGAAAGAALGAPAGAGTGAIVGGAIGGGRRLVKDFGSKLWNKAFMEKNPHKLFLKNKAAREVGLKGAALAGTLGAVSLGSLGGALGREMNKIERKQMKKYLKAAKKVAVITKETK